MARNYDVVVAGGSVSGLLAAREIASSGYEVIVLEEDYEIGTPEHCGGLVSIKALKDLGIIPSSKSIICNVNEAKIMSASNSFDISAVNENIVVLDRRDFDKQLAFQAQKEGAEIVTKYRVTSSQRKDSKYLVKSNQSDFLCDIFIDARGISSIIQQNRIGVLQSAQYEIYADWLNNNQIIVQFDTSKYPDFFAWVIPMSNGKAKIGVAGRKINSVKVLEDFIKTLGDKYSIIRKIYAPIWIGGPLKKFIFDKTVVVGDAAGQTKPTTAGGIYSCGMGGILAGKSISRYLDTCDITNLYIYENDWNSIFQKEFNKMLFFRKMLSRLDNTSLDKIFSVVSESDLSTISKNASFDFHSLAISKILGAKGIIKILNTLVGNEMRHIMN
ncbi:MAG: geranylgeranyl reductase family protein [Nitrososphaeraceae archaeon]